MLTIVVYELATGKVIFTIPLIFEGEGGCHVQALDSLIYEGYGYQAYIDSEPVFFEDIEGDICLRKNCSTFNSSDWLESYDEEGEE